MTKKIEFHFKSPEKSPGYLLGQLTLLWQRKQKKVLDPLDLTQTQFILMAAIGWLSRENEIVTQIDIANQTNFDRMMVSKVLRTLESKSIIKREEHETDTRAKVIALTNKGFKLLQNALMAIEKADVEFFSAIEKELPSFNSKMIKVINHNQNE